MERTFIPIIVNNGKKHGIWQLDVTDLSLSELIKLKEEIKKSDYIPTITSLDSLITQSMKNLRYKRKKNNDIYIRQQNRNIIKTKKTKVRMK